MKGECTEEARKIIRMIVNTDAMEPKDEGCPREVEIDGQNSQIRNSKAS